MRHATPAADTALDETEAIALPDDPADLTEDAVDEIPPPSRGLGLLLTIGGLIGAVAAFVLVLEKLALLENPRYIPSCSIDPVLSCGSVMKTAQASLLGFPNPIIGVATFPVVVVAGVLVLGRVELPRWFWLCLQAGVTVGVVFIHWLIIQTLGVIHALCPYCIVVWAVMIPIFWFTTTYNLAAGHLDLGAVGRAVVGVRYVVLVGWYLLIVAAVVASFPTYFGSMVGLS